MRKADSVRYGSIDRFRLLAAALVVAIHTSPLTTFSADADFFLTRVLARVAVPFFFMVTGQFVVPSCLDKERGALRAFRYVKKIALLYGIAILLYLPAGIYAGHYEKMDVLDVLRMLLFDGTFYHLWYFPACIMGVLLVFWMGWFLQNWQMLTLAAVLYGIGLFGDSYYGLVQDVPVLADLYGALFQVFSYTRNGIFMAPLFLLLGAQAGRGRRLAPRVLGAGCLLSFIAMSEEAFLLRHLKLQRHDSMYLCLPAVMFFLYRILLSDTGRVRAAENRGLAAWRMAGACGAGKGKAGILLGHAGTVSALTYILHPAMILAVRAVARAAKISLLVENSLLHYFAVLVSSAIVSLGISLCLGRIKGRKGMENGGRQERATKQDKGRHERMASRKKSRRDRGKLQDKEASWKESMQGKKTLGEGLGQDKAASQEGPKPGQDTSMHGRYPETFPYGRAWLELDRRALKQNVDMLRRKLPKSCRLMPAVKADAYGHGAVLVAGELQKAGVDAFCVACAQEGIQLRKAGILGTILVLGYTHPGQFALLEAYRLTQTVVDYGYAKQLDQYGKDIHVHIGVDSGMHRLGIRSDQPQQVMAIYGLGHLTVDGLYTHLCVSDVENLRGRQYTGAQADAFCRLVALLRKKGYPCPNIHMQASYGVLNYPELAGDYARVGIALYGVLSTKEDTRKWQGDLTPVLSLKARIATVKQLYQGESAGYGMAFTAKQDMKIATLAIGYADGLPRALSNGVGSALIHGRMAPVIGRICMDQTMVDVSGIEDVQAGEEAVLIGHSGGLEISACDIARQAGTITNEILSRMGARLERVFV